MKVLLFLKNLEASVFFKRVLSLNGHDLEVENTFESALSKFLQKDFDVVLTDCAVGMDKLDFCRTIKLHKESAKVIAVCSLEGYEQRENLHAHIGAGDRKSADVHLRYPCSIEEVMAIISKFEPRYLPKAEEPLVLGDLELHPASYEAFRAGKRISLRRKEYQLLEFMIRNKNRVINRHTILEYIWNYDTSAMTNTLDVHMSTLRKKIDRDYPFKMLQTIYGAGYKLRDR